MVVRLLVVWGFLRHLHLVMRASLLLMVVRLLVAWGFLQNLHLLMRASLLLMVIRLRLRCILQPPLLGALRKPRQLRKPRHQLRKWVQDSVELPPKQLRLQKLLPKQLRSQKLLPKQLRLQQLLPEQPQHQQQQLHGMLPKQVHQAHS